MDKDTRQPNELDILSEFPPPTWEEWKKNVEETLKGAPYEKVMMTKTYEGIDLQPIYRFEDIKDLPHLNSLPGQPPFVRGNSAAGYLTNGWIIAQQQNQWNPSKANLILLDELNRGLNSVNLKLNKHTRWAVIPPLEELESDGIWLNNLNDVSILLNNVDLTAVPLFIDGGEAAIAILGLFNAYFEQMNIPPEHLSGFIGFDLFSSLVKDGELPFSEDDRYLHIYQMSNWAIQNAPNLRTILLDGAFWGNCGANAVQELAVAMSSAVEYINALQEKGLALDRIVPRFLLKLSLGSNLYMEIAKVRAARLLWSELMKAYNVPAEISKIWIHAVTTSFNKTMYDPYVNVLRTATESFSGVIGGIDSLEVTPFDIRIKTDDEFSRRIARNQQLILMEEAHLNKVTDPAGGCYYIEKLTAELAEQAWVKMQSIEQQGGLFKAIKKGLMQSEISKVANEKIQNSNKRKDIFVGINMFVNSLEQPLENGSTVCKCELQDYYDKIVTYEDTERPELHRILQKISDSRFDDNIIPLLSDAFINGAVLEEVFDLLIDDEEILKADSLNESYGTRDIERLRQQVIAYQQKNQTVLSVFLANMGSVSQHKARADFSTGFFQVAGFYVANTEGFYTVEEAAESAILSNAQAVCICSTDDTYPALVPALITQIKAKKPDMIFILAGYPQDMTESYQKEGIDIFIHIRANAYETLSDLAERMGVK